MGWDIHCYIEYRTPGARHWFSFGGDIVGGPDYELFGRLAGVCGRPSATTVAPRGIPADLGVDAATDHWLWIARDDEPLDGGVSVATAEGHVLVGRSRYRESDPSDEQPRWVSNPDALMPTWLTADEIEAALDDTADETYWATLAAMRSLESRGMAVRAVIWFDR